MLLSGDSDTSAIAATFDYFDFESVRNTGSLMLPSGRAVAGQVVMLSFRSDATIGEINGVIKNLGGHIVGMLKETGVLAVKIPEPQSGDDLQSLVDQINTLSFIEHAGFGELIQVQALPGNVPTDNVHRDIAAQVAARAPGLWNARKAYQPDKSPIFVIPDCFHDGPPLLESAQFDVVLGNVSDFLPYDFITSACWGHGYGVLGMAAATFGGGDIDPLQVTGMIGDTVVVRAAEFFKGSVVHNSQRFEVNGITEMALVGMLRGLPREKKIVLNTSYNFAHPLDEEAAKQAALNWLKLVRTIDGEDFSFLITDLEKRLVHVTSAGNQNVPAKNLASSAAASIYTNLEKDGLPIPSQKNVLIVEARDPVLLPSKVSAASCNLSRYSAIKGNISAVGTVYTFIDAGLTGKRGIQGTSFSAPQVAGVATWMWSVDSMLTSSQIVDIILKTTRAPCNEYSGSKMLDAYGAALGVDTTIEIGKAPVRTAILDLSSNGIFDDKDAEEYFEFVLSSKESPDYSRYDLNGDGFTGATEVGVPFDLDGDRVINATPVTRMIKGRPVSFDERNVTDLDILCFYSYSPIWQGADEVRKKLHCGVTPLSNQPKNQFFTATHVDNKGQVSGSLCTLPAPSADIGFCKTARSGLYSGGTVKEVGSSDMYEAISISNSGHILARGSVPNTSGVREYLLTPGPESLPETYTTRLLSFADGFFTATSVDRQGRVGGSLCRNMGSFGCEDPRAVLDVDGDFIDISSITVGGFTFTNIISLSDAGHIIARAVEGGGYRDFLLTPIVVGGAIQYSAELLTFVGGANTIFTPTSVNSKGVVGGSLCELGVGLFCSNPTAYLCESGLLEKLAIPDFTDVLSISDTGFILVRDSISFAPGIRDYLISPAAN